MNHLAKVIYKQLEDLNYLDKHLLKALHNTGDTLIIQGKEYQVRIDGSEILNPNHEVDLNYQIVENENGYLLAVNDGRSLPGPIYLHFYNDQEIQLTDYNGYIYIEDNVRIALNTSILTNNHDFYERDVLTVKDVRICKNAWNGAGVTILPGVTIGENAIVGAASVATKDVAPNTVVAGNPAKVIRELDGERFKEE